jgi:integrase
VSYSVRYRDPAGRSRRKVFAGKVDATNWLAENIVARKRGAWVDPAASRDRLGEWAERWFSSTVALRPGTRRTYRLLLDNQILPHLGAAPLASIDPLAVQEWQAGLVVAGLSPSRIRNAAQVLGQILDAAVAGGRLHRNPAQGLRRPRIIEREMTFLSATELEQLTSQITDPYGLLVLFLGWTGLRIGEAAALRVGRLDLLARRVEVVEAATEVNGRLAWGPTKTGERRTVPLPRFLAEQLGAYLADRPHSPADLVFTMPRGGPLRASKWGERYFHPAVAAAGLPEGLRVHDLRHTAASLAIRENASVKIVQAMLGHRSATQTLDRYGHLYPSDLDALAERLERAHAAAAATELWPPGWPRSHPAKRKARSMTWPCSGGGETRTPVPRRRSRDSPSAAAG